MTDIYLCDPTRNTHCDQQGCCLDGGPCISTRRADAAAQDADGFPLMVEQTRQAKAYFARLVQEHEELMGVLTGTGASRAVIAAAQYKMQMARAALKRWEEHEV